MPIYCVTGKLGSGKTLIAVGKALDYAAQGRRVVANFHIDTAPACRSIDSKLSNAVITVIPPRPTSDDLRALGRGGETEDTAGLLILDECAVFLNSRDWNSADRKGVVDWFLHARKLKWDVLLIVQHQSMLDKQVREAICELLAVCRRMDRMNIPVLSWFWAVKLPRLHVAQVRYGMGLHDPKAETWVYRGTHLFACYATEAIFDGAGDAGIYSVIPPKLSKFRYLPPPFNLKTWLQDVITIIRDGPPKPHIEPKPKTRLAELLMQLPEPERLRHWRKLESLGAFA
jgi:hypothetical protein